MAPKKLFTDHLKSEFIIYSFEGSKTLQNPRVFKAYADYLQKSNIKFRVKIRPLWDDSHYGQQCEVPQWMKEFYNLSN